MPDTAYYFFEYPNPCTGRPIKTSHRMSLEMAKERHGDSYKPILSTVEYRKPSDGKPQEWKSIEPGQVPAHMKVTRRG